MGELHSHAGVEAARPQQFLLTKTMPELHFSLSHIALSRLSPDTLLTGEVRGRGVRTVESLPWKAARRPLKLGEGLGRLDYERVAAKVALHNVPDGWCEADECACRGCANEYLSWAEYECWKKYAPEFNVTREG